MQTFEEYCYEKRIDAKLFQEKEKALWQQLESIFEQVSPESFTQQKLFLINNIRRRHLLPEDQLVQKTKKQTTIVQQEVPQKIVPKIKIPTKKIEEEIIDEVVQEVKKPALKVKIPIKKVVQEIEKAEEIKEEKTQEEIHEVKKTVALKVKIPIRKKE